MTVCNPFPLNSGFHESIIHNKPSMLNRLLDLLAQYPQLKQSVNDQNALFQVCNLGITLCLLKRRGGDVCC